MANAKRLLDAARSHQIELLADVAVERGPFVMSARDRARGATILGSAVSEGAVLPNVVADIANAISRAITSVITDKRVGDRLVTTADAYLVDAVGADGERRKLTSAISPLVSIVLQQSIGLGADIALRAHLDNELLRRMPRDAALDAARRRKAGRESRRLQRLEQHDTDASHTLDNNELVDDEVRGLVDRHLHFLLRDPRDPLLGQRLKMGPLPPPFSETDDNTVASEESRQVEQPSYLQTEGGRPLTIREIMVKTMAAKR